MLWFILVIFVFGIIFGALARLIVPGRDRMGIVKTWALGVGGSLLGGFLGYAIFGADIEDVPADRRFYAGGGGSVRAARLMGVARMTDMMLTGRVASAEEGERWNLCQYIVEPGEAKAKALELARNAAGNAELSNYAVLHALPRIQDMAKEDGLFVESLMASFTATSPEAEERLRAFLEKRAKRLNIPKKD